MLRLNELKLPLGHPPDAVRAAVAERLGVSPADILDCRTVRRAHDARRKSAILMVYSVDVSLSCETAVLARFAGDPQVTSAPDTSYKPVARATGRETQRPLVIGTGPCGLFARLPQVARKAKVPYIRDVRSSAMTTLTVTAKGQVTLRKDLLAHLGVRPGEKIVVEALPDGRLEARAARRGGKIADVFGILKRRGAPALSIEENNEITADGWANRRS